jgi:hypothetical protein
MTEMQMRATSPKAATTSYKNCVTALVLDADDDNTAFTHPRGSGPSWVVPKQAFLLPLLSLVAQTPSPALLKDALTEGGFDFEPVAPETVDPLSRTAIKYQLLLDNSLNMEEVARRLGTDVEGIVRRLADRTLYGIQTKDGWKIPEFQFADGELLPGLESVLPLLHEGLHPIALQNWLTNPDPDLSIGEEPVSPRQWLLSGRDVANVARIALDL